MILYNLNITVFYFFNKKGKYFKCKCNFSCINALMAYVQIYYKKHQIKYQSKI